MLIYVLVLLNLGFLAALFFIFRYYIRRELNKVEYVRHVEKELQQLLLVINRSAEDVTQVIEDRIQQLRELLAQNKESLLEARKGKQQQNDSLEQQRLNELRQGAAEALDNLELRLLSFHEQLDGEELFLSFIAKLKQELLEAARLELQRELQQAIGALQEAAHAALAKECEKYVQQPAQPKPNEFMAGILNTQLRAEIEQYIELGLDARIISQKTKVPLNLVELMIGMKGYN